LEQVRKNPQWAKLPFIIMSAHSSSDERRNAIERGADDFLVKPFSLEDFQKILNRWNPPD
jgi:CheY-like chemotaxis protein